MPDRRYQSRADLESPFLDEMPWHERSPDFGNSDLHNGELDAIDAEYELAESCEGEIDDGHAHEQEGEHQSGTEREAALAWQARGLTDEKTLDLDLETDVLMERQLGAPPVNAYGSYNLRSGNAAVRFWPLAPGTTVAAAAAPPPGAPASPPARIAIVDVVVVPTEGQRVLSSVAAPNLLTQVTPQPPAQSMPLVPDATGASRLSFAVSVPANATHFEGTLRLEIRRGAGAPGTATNVDLPIRVAAGARVADLVVFFVLHGNINRRYAWMKLRAVRDAQPQNAIDGAEVQLNFLRDNLRFRTKNRRIALRTTPSGFVAFGGRGVVGVPIDWPLIFKANAQGFASRGHLVRLAARNIANNLTPFVADPALRMIAANVSLQARRFMLDAGHGVVYALTSARRSQEWYVAHRIVDRISELLRQRHNVNAADIFLTRTAGFGLIEPGQINAAGAPERGAGRFAFDLANRRIRIANNTVGLVDLSALVLTRHTGAAHTAQPIPAAERTRLLTINADTVTAIQTRLNQQLAPGHRVSANSIRWHTATGRYLFTREPAAGGAGVADLPLPIRQTDWWTLDDAMMETLIDRSARWSILNEIGSVAAAQQIAGHPFQAAARNAMLQQGALDYMRNKIRSYLPPAPDHAWATGGTKGWGLARRVQFYNATNCDLYISVHANAAAGVGGMCLVSRAAQGPNVPPADQIRVGKIALKYLDAFDQGLRGGGIVRENPGNATPPLQAGNQRRGRYLYFEIEFMDARNPANANQYRYEQMVEQAFIDRVAEQIVAAALEIVVSRQGGLDAVTLNNDFRPLW